MAANRRAELLRLLTTAAELEHSLTCQYLFAAFSLKHDTSEGLTDEQVNAVVEWERLILMVARQEMEHLGLVVNLLTALGGAPWLGHPRFPYSTHLFGHQMALERFSIPTLEKFVCFERPEDVGPVDAFCKAPPQDGATAQPYTTVGELYERVKSTLVAAAREDSDLFIGPPAAQVVGGMLGTDFPRLGAMGGGYDIFLRSVTDLPSALAAIDLVIEQGEGTPHDGEVSHYRRFLDILHAVESADPPFEAARAVVANPVLGQPIGLEPGTVVTNADARAVMELFDDAYRTMLMLLTRLFAHTDETENDLAVLRSVAFFPLMTMAVRPLGEVLTSLPAHDPDDGLRAGPSFDAGGPIAFLPHREAAWKVLEEALRDLADRATQLAKTAGMPERLGYIAHSLDLIARRFAAGVGIGAA